MPNPINRLVRGARLRTFGYDATEDKGRRQAPVSRVRSEDAELAPEKRKALVTTARDLRRNFSIAGWAIRKHLDFVSMFSFQSKTGIEALDNWIERRMRWWGRRQNCDVAARHSLPRMIRLLEECRLVDGDVFLMKVADGRLQAIEGDRVQTPYAGLPDNFDRASLVHGVKLSAAGQAEGYCVCKRSGDSTRLEFERLVPAINMVQHGFFDRFDQVRGISPLAAAINAFRDVYEGCDYALAKMKVAQMFGLVLYRDAAAAVSDVLDTSEADTETADGASGAPVEPRYKIDFGRGPVLLDLDPGDKAEFLENKTPSPEFQAFCQVVIGAALKALDIPYSFYDESFTNFFGSRSALNLYLMSADAKRADVRDVLDHLTAWRLSLDIADGTLTLPAGMTLSRLVWDWVPRGLPWWNPLQEAKADIAEIEAGLSNRTLVLRAKGLDFYDVADTLAEEEAYLLAKGLKTDVSAAGKTVGEENDDE